MSIQFPNLGINLDYVGESIQIFGFEITFFGLIIALGMLLGLGFVILEAKRCGENKDEYLEMMIISLLFGVIGARLLYVACSWNLYKGNIVQIFNIRNGGLCFYGGLFGGMLGAAIYCGVRRKPFMQMADTASMGIIVAQIIGRWGDFFNRESFGEYTNSIFAMQLPLSAVRSSEVTSAMRENLETIGGTSYIQVHPTFFYESAWCLLLFLLMLVWKRKKCFQGQVFLRYLAGYGLGRFVIEYLRTDKLLIPGTSIGISQLISAALFVICAMIAVVEETMAKKRAARRRRRREQDYEAQERAAREAEAEEYRDRLRLERAFADGDAAYFSNLPVKAMVQAIKNAGYPSTLSNTAGTYICNHVMYGILYYVQKEFPNARGGFIHVPYAVSQVVNKPATPSMAIADITAALEAAVKAAVEYEQDIKVIGGETH